MTIFIFENQERTEVRENQTMDDFRTLAEKVVKIYPNADYCDGADRITWHNSINVLCDVMIR